MQDSPGQLDSDKVRSCKTLSSEMKLILFQQTDGAALLHVLQELTQEGFSSTSDPGTSEGLATTKNADGLRCGERVQRPTWKVVQAQLEPTPINIDFPEPPAVQPVTRVQLLVRPTYSQNCDSFGLSCSYKGQLSSVPDDPSALLYIPGYSHPEPHKEAQTIDQIIAPYPNLSSFLFDHHFWTVGTYKSRNDRDAMQALIAHPKFKPDDIKDTDFRQIKEELHGCSSQDWWEQEQGWKKTEIHIGIPIAQKQTAAVWRENAAHQTRLRNAPCPPPSAKANLDGFPRAHSATFLP